MAGIRWKRGDYITLGRAVSDFNKKKQKIENEENKLYLPNEVSYKNLKDTIKTRKELERVIKSLKEFKKEGAEELITTSAGETITKWEKKNLESQMRIARASLRRSARELEKPISSGYSKAQMGSIEYRKILENLRTLKDLDKKAGKKFQDFKSRIEHFGNYDYEYLKATIYRENWERALKESGAENFENYEKLMKKLNRIKNPINFFKLIQKSEVFSDIFVYYKEGYGVAYNFSSDEERFNYALEELEVI